MTKEQVEVRKLPKKSIVIIIIMSIIMAVGFAFITYTKSLKLEEILNNLGFTNISNVKVVDKLSVEHKVTKIKSTVYKVVFYDDDKNQECYGFVHRSNDGKYTKDIDCKRRDR